MHSDSSVPEHSLWTRGRHYDPFIYADGVVSVHENVDIRICQTRILYGVREGRDDTKLELFFGVIARHVQKCSLLKLFLVDLNKQPAKKHSWQYHGRAHLKVRECGVETDTPIDKAIRAVYDPFLV